MFRKRLQLCRPGRITAIVLEIWQSPSCSSACFLSGCAETASIGIQAILRFLHPVTGSEFSFLVVFISVTFPPAQKWCSLISWLFWGHTAPESQGITLRAGGCAGTELCVCTLGWKLSASICHSWAPQLSFQHMEFCSSLTLNKQLFNSGIWIICLKSLEYVTA